MSLFDLAQLRSPPSPERFRSAATREEVFLSAKEAGLTSTTSAESYQHELHNLLEKSRGTPYEATLRRFVETKASNNTERTLWRQRNEINELADGQGVRLDSNSPSVKKAHNQLVQAAIEKENSPTRSKARSDLEAIIRARDQQHHDWNEHSLRKDEEVHQTRRSFESEEDWLNRISKPKRNQTRAFELAFRLQNRVMRNTTNHIGRQRTGTDASGPVFTAFGEVNLNTLTGGVAASNNDILFKSATNDARKNIYFAGSNLALKNKRIQSDAFQKWLDDNQRWKQTISEKKQHLEREQHQTMFHPRINVLDQQANQLKVDAALRRESSKLRDTFIEQEKRHQSNSPDGHNIADFPIAPPLASAPVLAVVPAERSTVTHIAVPSVQNVDTNSTRRVSTISKLFASVDDDHELEFTSTVTDAGVQLPPPPSEAPPNDPSTSLDGTRIISTPHTHSPSALNMLFSKSDWSLSHTHDFSEVLGKESWELRAEQQQKQSPKETELQEEVEERGRARFRDTYVSQTKSEISLGKPWHLGDNKEHANKPVAERPSSRSYSPNVFDRMCVRIAAHTLKAQQPVEPDVGSDNRAQCTFKPQINAVSYQMVDRRNRKEFERRTRSASPAIDTYSTSRRRGTYFGLRPATAVLTGANATQEPSVRSDSVPQWASPGERQIKKISDILNIPQRESAAEIKAPTSILKNGRDIFDSPMRRSRSRQSAGKPVVPIRKRSASASPSRPVFSIRSVGENYILKTDSIDQGLQWAKRHDLHKRWEAERRRSPSPARCYASPVHVSIMKEHQRVERRKSFWSHATNTMKQGHDKGVPESLSVTERLNRFYAQRDKNNQLHESRAERERRELSPTRRNNQSFSPKSVHRVKFAQNTSPEKSSTGIAYKAAESGNADELMRRRSKRWNDFIFQRSGNRNKSFEQRTSESVEEFVLKRGVSDMLLLKGVAPCPGTYFVPTKTVEKFSASNYRKNLAMKNDNFAEGLGNAENGRAGYTFAKKQRQFAQYGHVKIQGLAHKLLDRVLVVTQQQGEEEVKSSAANQSSLLENSGAESDQEENNANPSPKPKRRQSMERFDRWGNML